MNYKFRDTEKSLWQTKRGCVVSMKAPDMPPKEFRMNQTGTDQPFEDGLKELGYSHYRKRVPGRELTSTEFKRHGRSSTRDEAFSVKYMVGSLR